ncbi:DNA ligase 4 [Ceratocystis fimbriata CBS 114723]|uniref:DNA ligase n=1 Tax=Ceratocystis fimbriata CBS 114723 TaxID=1035309 RepID=A0A2C5X1L8_9PEZI|nr:DNA ligase 4 [Ceratocystis fimbriata CBS 114723]
MSQPPKPSTEPDLEAVEEDARQYAALLSDSELQKKRVCPCSLWPIILRCKTPFSNRPRNIHKTLRFSELYTALFDQLLRVQKKPTGPAGRSKLRGAPSTKLSPHEQKRHVIGSFIYRWRNEVGNDFYPAMRLILPDKDSDRGVYGLKENAIGKLLVKLMQIDKNSEDGYNLLHWRLPSQTFAARMAGDFPGRCYEILSKRPMQTEPGPMTIADVNEQLDKLSAASGEAENLEIFRVFYNNMCSEEMLWIIRIILRQMRVGATEKTLLNLWHRDADALFNVSSSLRRVCWELWDPTFSLSQEDAGITLGQCFQPQLAQFQMPASFERIVKYLRPEENDSEFWIEEKLDGERIQMHMTTDATIPGGKRFYWFSRKSKDYTYLYGDNFEQRDSAMTKHLKDCFDDRVENVILDGEMITWDPENDIIMPFGTLKTAANEEKRRSEGEKGYQPFFCVFDLLHMNGHDLTRYTLRDRRAALERIIKPHKHQNEQTGEEQTVRGVFRRLEIHNHVATSSADDIEPALRDVINRSSEGLVLKNPRSMYRLNSRNDDWLKVKPEYMNEFGEALDCVIIGGYYGSGKRGNTLASYLCGLRASDNHIQAGARREKCWSFFRVGGGFSADDYQTVRHHTEGKWHAWDPKNPPTEFIELGGSSHQAEKPDMWIRPSESIVLEVKAASVAVSDSFAKGKTLRFPRLRRIRLDKSWDMALSMDEFDALNARVDDEVKRNKEMTVENRKRAHPTAKRARRALVVVGAEDEVTIRKPSEADVANVTLFSGLKFCVMSDAMKPLKHTKAELELLIKAHGGIVRQRVSDSPDDIMVLVADRKVVSVASAIKKGGLDVIRPQWILDCISQPSGGSILPYEGARHLLHATPITQKQVSETIDIFGDSFARDISIEELKDLFASMPKVEDASTFERTEFITTLAQRGHDIASGLKGYLFNGNTVLFRQAAASAISDELSVTLQASLDRDQLRLENYVRFGSGRVSDSFHNDVTHVVVVGDDPDRASEVKESVRKQAESQANSGGRVPVVVWSEWVEDCWRKSMVSGTDMYLIS